MPPLSRLAVALPLSGSDGQAVLWGLLETLRRQGLTVQTFRSQACFAEDLHRPSLSGFRPRYLDSWLMPEEICLEAFHRGSDGAQLAMVEGCLESADESLTAAGGSLEQLCEWLNLPILAVIDIAGACRCCLPQRPVQADGLLLDGVAAGNVARVATDLEAVWGIPVIGALEALPGLRRALAAAPCDQRAIASLSRELGNHFSEHWNRRRWQRLLARPELPRAPAQLFRQRQRPRPLRVALALDEAFNRYFPDCLDLLELRGATVTDFSPLREDRLPLDSDVVYLGCGHPERHAAELAANHCMKLALRNHVRRGGRIYAEGRGTAYLCQAIRSSDGSEHPMVGLFSTVASFGDEASKPQPAEITLHRDTWLAPQGICLRGYRHRDWSIRPLGPSRCSCAAEAERQYDLLESCQVVASRLNLNLAAYPELLGSFFQPCCAARAVLDV